jgi:pimeloyl-ACP methyl ester carboxylesterase
VAPPLADCDAIAAWLNDAPESRASRPTEEPAALREEPILATATFRESAIVFGRDGALAGILCRPYAIRAEAAGRAVVFLNTGANSHIGAGRASVFHARGLAELGIASLRMDIAGIGDSSWTDEGPLSAIHRAERASDVSEAIDALRALGYSEISLVGICSGAFLAFQTAIGDPRVDGILIANPQFWLPPSVYVTKILRLTTWRRAIKGEFELATWRGIVGELVLRSARLARARLQRAMPKLFERSRGQRKFLALLRRLAARGCRVRLLLSEGDPSSETLAALLPGGDFAALDGLMRIETMGGADHDFVMRRTRGEFFARLREFLEAPPSAAARREKAA